MQQNQTSGMKKKRILPRKSLLPVSRNNDRDRLAWALARGWVKPVDSRRLTVYVIESRKGLPVHIRIRDWILMSLAWLGWGLLLIDAAVSNSTELGQQIGPGYWTHDIAKGLLVTFSIVGVLIFILANFGVYTLYRARHPRKKILEPEPLSVREQSSCSGYDVKILKEWHMARSLSVEINEEGTLHQYESFPKELPEDFIL